MTMLGIGRLMQLSKPTALAALGTDGRLLLSATIASFVAGIGFLLVQAPAIGNINDFKWFRSTCWLNPCSTAQRPQFPWERYVSISLERDYLVGFGAAGPNGTFLLMREHEGEQVRGVPAGDLRRLTVEGRWERSIPPPEGYQGTTAIAIGSDTSYVIGAANLDEPRQGHLFRWELNNTWSEISSPPTFPYIGAMAVRGPGQFIVSGRASQASESIVARSLPAGGWDVFFASDPVRISAIAMSPDNNTIVTGHADGRVLQIAPDGSWTTLYSPAERVQVTALAITGKHNTIVVGYEDASVFYADHPYRTWRSVKLPRASQSIGTAVLAIGPNHTIVTSSDAITTAWVPVTPALCTWILLLLTTVGVFWFVRTRRNAEGGTAIFGSNFTLFIITWIEFSLPTLLCFSTIIFYLMSSLDLYVDTLLILYTTSYVLYIPYLLFRRKSIWHRWIHVYLSTISFVAAALVLFLRIPDVSTVSWMISSSLLVISNLVAIPLYAIPALKKHTTTVVDSDSSTTSEVRIRIDSIRELFVGFHQSVIGERDRLEDTLQKVALEIELQSNALADAEKELEETREKVKEYEAIAGLTETQRDIFLTKIVRTKRFESVVVLLLGVLATLLGAMLVEAGFVSSLWNVLSGR